jgi:capsular polysaccharide biosynthesis protein
VPDRNDDPSLRDIYLTLRRYLWLIVLVAAAFGIVAFVTTTVSPSSYRATAVVQLTPSPIGEQQVGGIDLAPTSNLSFEAYSSIVLDGAVLTATLDRLEGIDLSANGLRRRSDLRRLAGPANANQIAPLTVEHSVSGSDPDEVLRIAQAWSEAGLDGIRRALTSSLTSMAESTAQTFERRQVTVTDLEAAWLAFRERDERDGLGQRLHDLTTRRTHNAARLDELDELIAIADAQRGFLHAQIEQNAPGAGSDAASQIATLVDRGRLAPATAARLRALLSDRPDTAQALEQDLLRLLLRADLQTKELQLVAHLAERDALGGEVERLDSEASVLRASIAVLERDASRLERERRNAQRALDSVADIVPVLDYASDLLATSVTLLSSPTVGVVPTGRGRWLNTAIAALLGALLATLFAFGREAVRVPSGGPSPTDGSAGADPAIQGASQRQNNP